MFPHCTNRGMITREWSDFGENFVVRSTLDLALFWLMTLLLLVRLSTLYSHAQYLGSNTIRYHSSGSHHHILDFKLGRSG